MPGRQHLLLQQNSLSALQDKEYKLKSQARRIFQPVHHMPPESRFIIFSLPQTIVLCDHVGTRPKLMSSIALPQPPLCVPQPHSSTSATSFPNPYCYLNQDTAEMEKPSLTNPKHNVSSSSQFPFHSGRTDAGSCLPISCTKYSEGRAGSDTWVQRHHKAVLTYGVALPHFTPSICNLCHFGGPKQVRKRKPDGKENKYLMSNIDLQNPTNNFGSSLVYLQQIQLHTKHQ